MGSKKLSPEQKWQEQAEAFKREAEKLPYGKEREKLLLLVRQLGRDEARLNRLRIPKSD
jgi:hypothetical protein